MINATSNHMLFVLGMHRSGTSALTGTLQHLGVELGRPLIAPGADNPKGYFEHAHVVDINHGLLAKLGASWDDPTPLPRFDWHSQAMTQALARAAAVVRENFAGHPLSAIKDPRLCRFVQLWARACDGMDIRALIAVRDPADVIASLARRNGLSGDVAALLWLRHNVEAERDTRGMRRGVCFYENLMADWRNELSRLASELGLEWPNGTEAGASEIEAFIEPALRHHRGENTLDGLSPVFRDGVETLRAAMRDGGERFLSTLADMGVELERWDKSSSVYMEISRATRIELNRVLKNAEQTWESLQWAQKESREKSLEIERLKDCIEAANDAELRSRLLGIPYFFRKAFKRIREQWIHRERGYL